MKSFDLWKAVTGSPQKKSSLISLINQKDKAIGSFIEFRGEFTSSAKGALAGVPFAVKDNIMAEGFGCTCGSKLLDGFLSPYNATAVRKLLDAGAAVIGKTNLDEFGMGSSTDNSGIKTTENPWKKGFVPGGSSGGSAAAVAAGFVPFALGSDTGGSVRQPASFCGVYGFKPTYGAVSRYGLVAYASSLECIGFVAESAAMCRDVFSIIKGADPNDQTSGEAPAGPDQKEVKTIAVLAGDLALDPAVQKAYETSAERLEKLGYKTVKIEIPMLEYVIPAYYTIATAEASANLARFDGVRYGQRVKKSGNPIELMQKTRDTGFGDEVKLRILLGTYVLRSGFQDQYYHRAQKIRTAIRNSLNKVFEKADALLSPVFPVPAFPHGESAMDRFQQKVADKFTATANLAGTPALSFPVDVADGLPVGMQLMAPVFCENRLFSLTEALEKEWPAPQCPGKIRLEDLK